MLPLPWLACTLSCSPVLPRTSLVLPPLPKVQPPLYWLLSVLSCKLLPALGVLTPSYSSPGCLGSGPTARPGCWLCKGFALLQVAGLPGNFCEVAAAGFVMRRGKDETRRAKGEFFFQEEERMFLVRRSFSRLGCVRDFQTGHSRNEWAASYLSEPAAASPQQAPWPPLLELQPQSEQEEASSSRHLVGPSSGISRSSALDGAGQWEPCGGLGRAWALPGPCCWLLWWLEPGGQDNYALHKWEAGSLTIAQLLCRTELGWRSSRTAPTGGDRHPVPAPSWALGLPALSPSPPSQRNLNKAGSGWRLTLLELYL
ncbi:uncharacterized protein LOC111528302 [Piliocolobus tephrosceles]|uniref:uncharacterized protein LOC111528302 n=1 Tax=Piliocolobus tephrosceles TaxID=591936 RepID=UPI000C2A9AEE|nr:uncharacterized protein LOC111528302 [Piliocolobus tephrosceles]